MKFSFFTPKQDLIKKKYQLSYDEHYGDGFFIDSKYSEKIGVHVSAQKLNFAFFILALILIILLIRTFYLQIIKTNFYLNVAEGNRIKTEILTSPRGIIYDRNNIPLTENEVRFSLYLEPQKKDSLELLNKISKLTNLELNEIQNLIQESQTDAPLILLADEIDYSSAMKIISNPAEYSGTKITTLQKRKYLYPYSSSHFLGYLGKINEDEWKNYKNQDYQFYNFVGKTGLEKEYEEILHGTSGKIEKEVDATGQIIKTLYQTQPISGNDLILTIDQELNQKLYDELFTRLQKLNLTKGAGIAINPKNGEILALVSFPNFNNNLFSNSYKNSETISELLDDEDQPLFNRVISGEYPSGSTFKILIGLAALEEKIITRWTQIYSNGGIQINQWFFPDWKAGGHGTTNITKALAESVNTFFYYIGGGFQNFKGLGLEKIVSYAKKLNFGKKLNIDLPNEASGFLPSREWKQKTKKEPWYIGDTYHLSIGQGDILVTPLQIASLTASIANNGKIYLPHLIKETFDYSQNKKNITQSKIISQNFAGDKNINIIAQGLRQAVLNGSAVSFNSLPFSSSAKTGTAQVGGDVESHAWFTVYAPAENPQIVITILIENGGDGSVEALPVAKEVLRWWGERNNF